MQKKTKVDVFFLNTVIDLTRCKQSFEDTLYDYSKQIKYTSSSAIAKRPRDASCLSVVS